MTSVAARVQKYRKKLRASGFRSLQLWVPDTRRKGFAEECKRQSLLIKHDSHEEDILQWIASVSDEEGWV